MWFMLTWVMALVFSVEQHLPNCEQMWRRTQESGGWEAKLGAWFHTVKKVTAVRSAESCMPQKVDEIVIGSLGMTHLPNNCLP